MRKKFLTILIAAMLLTVALVPFFGTGTTVYANGVDSSDIYTNVMEDLQRDNSFNAADYPAFAKDYSLDVISIAESSERELFVYVYQPSDSAKDLLATSINISTAINDSFYPKNYKLTLLSTYGVFDKYKVEGLIVKSSALRYYSIVSIYRAFDSNIDKELPGGTTNEVSYEVGRLYMAATENGKVSYGCEETETIIVTDRYDDFLRYYDGYKWFAQHSTDSHYIAFSTDKQIDRLIEADISFSTQGYRASFIEHVNGTLDLYNDRKIPDSYNEFNITLSADDEQVSNPADGFLGHKYTWDRIERVSEFLADSNNKFTDEAKKQIENKEWVLRFYETSFTKFNSLNEVNYTKVSEVTILRLYFMTDHEFYNLGVVDNKRTADNKPGNKPDTNNPFDIFDMGNKNGIDWLRIVGIVVGIILVAIMAKLIISLVRWIFKKR